GCWRGRVARVPPCGVSLDGSAESTERRERVRLDRREFLALPAGAAAIALAGCAGSRAEREGPGAAEPRLSEGGAKEPPSLPGRYGGSMTAMSLGDPKTF